MDIHGHALVLAAPCVLLIGALLQIAVAPLRSARVKGILAVISCLPATIAAGALIPSIHAGHTIDFSLFSWDGPLKLAIHVDGLGLLFALMGSGLGTVVLLYSVAYMERDPAATRFYTTMLLFIGGFIALVWSANLLLLYLFWEVIGLCSFSLVGFWYADLEAVAGARKVLLMTHLAGYGLLAAILILYHRAGTVLWTDSAVTRNFTAGVFVLMLIALVAKSVQVPLHTWIPDAMAAPTPVSSLLHAACYVTAGVYLAARMHSFGVWPHLWSSALVWIGTVTMAVGVMYAMVQTDLKRMLAFSTVSQIGYMIMALGIGTSLAVTAGLLHCLNHGFFKGGLFLNAGAVQHAAGTRDMNQLGGLAQRMPRTTLAWLIGVGSMAGIPLLSGFVSKWMLYAAALEAGWVVPALVAWIVSLGTVFLCAKATSSVFLGAPTPHTEKAHEAPPSMQWAMGLMAAGSIVLGIVPQLAVNYLLLPVVSSFAQGSSLQVTWFGLFTGTGSFSTTGGLVLALVSLVMGGVIYAFAYAVRPVRVVAVGGPALAGASGGIFTGGEPLTDQGRLTAQDFSRIFEQTWRPFFQCFRVDEVYLAIGRGLLAAARSCNVVLAWLEERASVSIVVVAALLLAGIRWFSRPVEQLPVSAPAHVPHLLTFACAVAAAALLLVSLCHRGTRRLALWMSLSSAAAIAGLLIDAEWLRFALLESAAVLTIPLVFRPNVSRGAKSAYVTLIAVSLLLLTASQVLIRDPAAAQPFFMTGVCLKLAAVPFLFWIARVADELPSLVLGQIVAVVDIAAFAEFFVITQQHPFILGSPGVWLAIAGVTSLTASILMLAQPSLKRLLVLSTVEDVGFLFLGLASARAIGVSGAVIAAATHALAKGLLFASLSMPEADDALRDDCTGIASRYPVSAFGFLFGMLAMLGIPPMLGYVGRWRLYETALQIHPGLLAVFVLSSGFALIAYVLALTRVWWGPATILPGQSDSKTAALHKEPVLLRIVLFGLVALLLLPGLWPASLQILMGGRP